jgi:hypothetical protein
MSTLAFAAARSYPTSVRGVRVAHYHHERNHQGLDNELIVGVASPRGAGTVRRAQRLGGLLNFYHRAA